MKWIKQPTDASLKPGNEIEFINITNVSSKEGVIVKHNTAGNEWNAGGDSRLSFMKHSKVKGVSFRLNHMSSLVFGFNKTNNSKISTNMDFAVKINKDEEILYVFENGKDVKAIGNCISGDKIEMVTNSFSFVDYKVNDQIRYTSTKNVNNIPLFISFAIESAGSIV